jgi:aminoglycoside 6'-N-acetyltransferase I
MRVRPATRQDAAAWLALRAALWPEADAAELRVEADAFFLGEIPPTLIAALFLAESGQGTLVGMLELSLRPYADGCVSSPVPFVEGWYVAPKSRRQGVGAALVRAAEDWALAQGYTEMASDALLENTISERAHKALGFDEVERAIRFRKELKR